MQQVDTIIHARWVIPVVPANTVYDNYALAIHEGKIIAIAPSADISAEYQAAETLEFNQQAIMPGLVNAHTHIAMNLLRGVADDLALMDWLQNHIWPTEQRWVGHDFVKTGSQHAIAEMLRGGVTCFNDMYFYPNATCDSVKQLGIRASIGINIMDVPTSWAKDANESIEKGLAVYEAYKDSANISFALAPHAVYTVQDDTFQRVAGLYEQYQLPIHIHVHETQSEVDDSVKASGQRPVKRLFDLGIMTPKTLAVHMTQINEEDLRLTKESGASVVHCPESNMKLASGYCPVEQFIDAGVNVALGTDGAASNNDLDMFGEMRSAALLAKLQNQNPESLPATTVLEMATINGARALGLADKIGSLEPNKLADLIAIDLNQFETIPTYHPIPQLVYSANRTQVTDVWVSGKRVLKERQLTGIDELSLIQDIEAWREKIAG